MRGTVNILDVVANAANIGTWDMDAVPDNPLGPRNRIIWSDGFRNMLGFSNEADFPNELGMWLDRLHPDDYDRVTEAVAEYIADAAGQTPFNMEYRLLKKNGEYAFVRASGVALHEVGTPLRFVGVIHDITEMKTHIAETERQREAAEAANRAKSIFLSHISHEIRTSVNAVLGTVEIQLQKETLSPDEADVFNRIYSAGSLLLNIINNLLDLSAIESGKVQINTAPYHLPVLLYDTMQYNLHRYQDKGIAFSLMIDENTPLDLHGDEMRIKQVLNNVLSNAFKYTERGEVKLSVASVMRSGKHFLVYQVSDTGQGMSEEQLSCLFDEYARFQYNRGIEGTGLGMTITKHLLDMMGGEINVKSTPGKGSLFTVWIPQYRAGTEVCGPDMAQKLMSNHYVRGESKEKITHDYMPYGRVLVVDDVESNLYVAKGLMAPYGLQIETAESGIEAVNKIDSGSVYDIIFMDHMMPKMDGMEATQIIRELGYVHPIVALTAYAAVGQEEMFLRNGFDGFLSKPIDLRVLNKMLNQWVRDKKTPGAGIGTGQEGVSEELVKAVVRDAKKNLAWLAELMPQIESADANVWQDFTTAVHGIKSVLANIGETNLSGDAFALEQAGRRGDKDEIMAKTPGFVTALQALIAHYASQFAAPTESETMQQDEKRLLCEKLDEIHAACVNFRRRDARTALDEIKKNRWPADVQALLEEIDACILHGNFKKAAETIEKAGVCV